MKIRALIYLVKPEWASDFMLDERPDAVNRSNPALLAVFKSLGENAIGEGCSPVFLLVKKELVPFFKIKLEGGYETLTFKSGKYLRQQLGDLRMRFRQLSQDETTQEMDAILNVERSALSHYTPELNILDFGKLY